MSNFWLFTLLAFSPFVSFRILRALFPKQIVGVRLRRETSPWKVVCSGIYDWKTAQRARLASHFIHPSLTRSQSNHRSSLRSILPPENGSLIGSSAWFVQLSDHCIRTVSPLHLLSCSRRTRRADQLLCFYRLMVWPNKMAPPTTWSSASLALLNMFPQLWPSK